LGSPTQTHPGRFHRLLLRKPFPKDGSLPEQLREKRSVTAHMPKEILARRLKKEASNALAVLYHSFLAQLVRFCPAGAFIPVLQLSGN
jgi:hypothetical protein